MPSLRKWRIVGFKHPDKENSEIYRQNLTDEGLIKAVQEGMNRGCNLFSIRGFNDAI